MKIRITETTFFLGKQRQVGDVLDNVIVGPFRTQVVPGGLERIPQYVEMPQELPQAPQPAPVAPSTAAVTVPPVVAIAPTEAAPVKAAPKANPLAARVRSLTARRAKFQDLVAGVLDTGEETMTKLETDAPVILAKANQDASDEYTAIEDLASAMKSFAASNGEPT